MGLTFTLQAILNDNLQVRVIRPLADSSLVFSLSHLLAPPSATTSILVLTSILPGLPYLP